MPEFYKKTCDAKTGMPWVLCDGKDNDQTRDYSSKNSMQLMTWDVTELALLYWYTDDESYAKRARELVCVCDDDILCCCRGAVYGRGASFNDFFLGASFSSGTSFWIPQPP